jgi:hypothetical protein
MTPTPESHDRYRPRIAALDERERLLDEREDRIARREQAFDPDDSARRREIDAEDLYPAMDD